MPDKNLCSDCKKKLNNNWMFCTYCGLSVSEGVKAEFYQNARIALINEYSSKQHSFAINGLTLVIVFLRSCKLGLQPHKLVKKSLLSPLTFLCLYY